jgi:hypothetical protein
MEAAAQMSTKGDFKKIQRHAEEQRWRVEKRKKHWLFFPPRQGAATMQDGQHPFFLALAG